MIVWCSTVQLCSSRAVKLDELTLRSRGTTFVMRYIAVRPKQIKHYLRVLS
jgi:hypothetical protein